jgi:hypothetical protein
MSDESLMAALEKLAKWRKFFASWQLGTRPDSDGESKAVRHHREATILLRAELSALTGLLIRKGLIAQAEFGAELEKEAARLDQDYADAFPGWSTTPDGLSMKLPEAADTMRRLGFPP